MRASYRANTHRIRASFRGQHCQGELRSTGLWLSVTPGAAEVPWSAFTNLQVFPTLVLLHAANGDVTVLPRDFFAAPDWPHAKRLLRTYVPSRGAVPRQIRTALLTFFGVALLATLLFFAAR